MSAPPPTQPPPGNYERPYYRPDMPPFPAASGELVVFLLVWLVVAIVALVSDQVGAAGFVRASVALAVAYIVSRGIAKAGKVFEDR